MNNYYMNSFKYKTRYKQVVSILKFFASFNWSQAKSVNLSSLGKLWACGKLAQQKGDQKGKTKIKALMMDKKYVIFSGLKKFK